jgi:hypothetical protein
MEHEDKESKTYIVKVNTYYSGTPEEFLRWRLILNEQIKHHGYDANYDMVMNLAQAMLVGRTLEAFLNERRAQETKNKTRKAKDQVMYTPHQMYDCAIFDKLLPLPQPPLRARTDARTNPSAQRATQLRRVLARVYAVSIQNQITTTVP